MPVDPQFALDYHGNTFSIDGIRIETEDGVNGGLFGNAVTARNVMIDGCYVGGLIGALDGEMTVGQCFVAAGINDSGSSGGYSGGTGGLIGCVTGNKKLEFQDCYFVGNIDRRGKTEKQDGGPTISRDWLGNTGIMAGNRSMPAVNLAAVPGEESMSNILSSGNENNADKTFSFSADLSWSSYPYKIWTKNGEDQTVYYGDWIDWKKLQ
ncbi:hypothetical protein WMO21_16050 [Lachnospiraceae bacterium CLA-AA-H58]|uniref:hypothetical protein n=1 Tax=Pilosibacter fragilis TaxID=3078042 RepID=UPI0032D40C9E